MAKRIASDTYKDAVEEIRTLIAQGKKEEAQKRKQQLPAFTPSGIFTNKRLSAHLEMYSGFVHLDFDKLTPNQMQEALAVITSDPHTFMCFVSPSGNGLKVFAEVDTGADQHESTWLHVMHYYERLTGLKADDKCKDITRLCFVSYDPHLYRNIANEKFHLAARVTIDPAPPALPIAQQPVTTLPEDQYLFVFQQQVSFTNSKTSYHEGNRNNYIYLLASNCNRAGIPADAACSLIRQSFDLPDQEMEKAIKSAYHHHAQEFARFAKSANNANNRNPDQAANTFQTSLEANEDCGSEDFLKSTPTIPDAVFDALPDILKQGSGVFPDKRKRDVFFTGAIAIISGCLPKVNGIYFQERVYPHLYTFIIAPAASGKGVMKNAKRLADKYHQKVLTASQEAQKRFEGEMMEYKEVLKKKKPSDAPPEKPEEPPFKIVFIPADSSQSRMVDHLQKNGGEGIICETEADTMSGAKKQDWGNYSPILRSAFHHEKIAFSRKTNNEYIEINEPRLAVALSGTPSQAPKLISSAEDGLFSRFLFYAFKNEIEWQDPSPKSRTVVYNDHFDALSSDVLRVIQFLDQSPTEVQLEPDQWNLLNETFSGILSEVTIFTSEEAAGIVYRLGLILFRFCMIFTALRKVENGDMSAVAVCTYQDFDTALTIVKTYLQHSLLMFNNLPKQNDAIQFQGGDSKRKFFEALPDEFTRKEATELGGQFKLAPRTIDDLLRAAVGKTLSKLKAGSYLKL